MQKECPVCGKKHDVIFTKEKGTRSERRRLSTGVCSTKCFNDYRAQIQGPTYHLELEKMECPVCGKLHSKVLSKPGGTKIEKRQYSICACSIKCMRIFEKISELAIENHLAIDKPASYDALIATFFRRRVNEMQKTDKWRA
jgi:sarcosine oxidase delta subunit